MLQVFHLKHQNQQKKKFGIAEEDDEINVASKYSKQSATKVITRFSKIWRRPEHPSVITKRSEEEKQLREFIYKFNTYRKEVIARRDKEEEDKMNLQWEAIMELPEDLRKIALLVDTHDEQPALIPLLTLTPPTPFNPKKKMQFKKKDKSLKRSERLITLSNL